MIPPRPASRLTVMENTKSFHKGEIVAICLALLLAILLVIHIHHAHNEDVVLAQKIIVLNQHVLALEKKVGQPAR